MEAPWKLETSPERRKCLRAAAQGAFAELREAELRLLDVAETSFENPEQQMTDGAVRAALVRWLCADPVAQRLVSPTGLVLRKVTLDALLDLDSIVVPFPLILRECTLPQGCNLRDANTRRLDFSGSTLTAIDARGAHIHGEVNLEGCDISGGSFFGQSVISGSLYCTGTILGGFQHDAIDLRNASIRGDLILNDVVAKRRAYLRGVSIGGNLECDGGTFSDGNEAFYASRSSIGGNVFLRNTKVTGVIRLRGVTIRGNLEFDHVTIKGSGELGAVAADALSVGGELIIRDCDFLGSVDLYGAVIVGYLECSRTRFATADGTSALVLASSKPKASVEFSGTRFGGTFDLSYAEIAGDFRITGDDGITGDDKITLKSAGNDALLAVGATVRGDVLLSSVSSAGKVNLHGIAVRGDLTLHGGRVDSASVSLDMGSAEVGGNIEIRDVDSSGEIDLGAGRIGGSVSVVGGRAFGPDRALRASRASVGGDFALRTVVRGSLLMDSMQMGGTIQWSCDARLGALIDNESPNGAACKDGVISLRGSRCDQLTFAGASLKSEGGKWRVDCTNVTVTKALEWVEVGGVENVELDLRDARCGRFIDARTTWPQVGALHLEGFVYGALEPSKVKERAEWLLRQPSNSFSAQPYQQVAGMFGRSGDERDAKTIAIAMERVRRQRGKLGLAEALGSVILGATIAYGYKPLRAVWIGLLIVVLSALVYGLVAGSAAFGYKKTEARASVESRTPPKAPPESEAVFNPIVYAADVFLPIVNLGQKDVFGPLIDPKCRYWYAGFGPCGRMLRLWILLEILLGWILTTAAVAGFSGLVHRVAGQSGIGDD